MNNIYYKQDRPEVLKYIPNGAKRLLDIGCGIGAFLSEAKKKTNAETWGVEANIEIASEAKSMVDYVLSGKIEDVIHSIPDNYFDCIIFNDVLEHLYDPTEILINIKTKLSGNGFILASIPNVRYYKNIYNLIIKKDWKYTDSGILDKTHIRFFTKSSMNRMFSDAGYSIIRQDGINSTSSIKFDIANILTFGLIADTRYLQYINIAIKK